MILFKTAWTLGYLPIRSFYPTTVFNKEKVVKKGGCIMVCNHYANMDILVLASHMHRGCYFLSKKELDGGKIKTFLMRKLGTIPVDRNNMSVETIKTVLKFIKKGRMVTIFPEGTRNKENTDLQEIKGGAALFAIKGQCPIIPVVLNDRPTAFKKNYIMVGDPIPASSLPKKASKDNIDAVADRIATEMEQLKTRLSERVANLKNKKEKKKYKELDNQSKTVYKLVYDKQKQDLKKD